MFDASEIYFLDRAIELGLLTAGQKVRLLEYAASMEGGTNVTTLVVDAGLMVEDEVRAVLDAVAARAGGHAGPQIGAMSHAGPPVLPREAAMAGAASVVTGDMLDALLDGEDVGVAAQEPVVEARAVAPMIQEAPKAVLPYNPEEFLGGGTSANDAAAHAGAQQAAATPQFQEGRQTFHLPGGTQPAFPPQGDASGGQEAYGYGTQEAYGAQDYGQGEYGQPGYAEEPVAAAVPVVVQVSAGVDEIDSLLE